MCTSTRAFLGVLLVLATFSNEEFRRKWHKSLMLEHLCCCTEHYEGLIRHVLQEQSPKTLNHGVYDTTSGHLARSVIIAQEQALDLDLVLARQSTLQHRH